MYFDWARTHVVDSRTNAENDIRNVKKGDGCFMVN